MQVDNIAFLQVLRLKDVELWQNKEGILSVKAKGNLQALYDKEMNIFALRLNDFKWHLTKTLQVVATFNENEGYYAYSLATFDGYYTFKVLQSEVTGSMIINFETFLANTCLFIRKDNIHVDLHRTNESKIMETIHKTLDSVTHAFHHHEKETEPNHRIIRSFQDLLTVEGHNAHIVDIPSTEVLTFLQETGEVARNLQDNEVWVAFRGELPPSLIETEDNLFIEKRKNDERLERWGSNITNASTSTQHSTFSHAPMGHAINHIPGEQVTHHTPLDSMAQDKSHTSDMLHSGNFRDQTNVTTNQPFDHTNAMKTHMA